MLWSKAFQTALYALSGVGAVTHRLVLQTLRKHELTEEDFWVNRHDIWQKIPLDKSIVLSIKNFKKEHNSSSYLESVYEKSIRVILSEEKEFPPLLRQIENHPPLLFARGAKLTDDESYLAVVGTREVTAYGKNVITEFVPTLVNFHKTIVSGFMYGVDVAAQRVALKAKGKTVGVLGFGFDHMYPTEHRAVLEEFLVQGATFLSPFAPTTPSTPGSFPARNEVVAGMSEGVLVIEGAEKSGSLITAHAAAEFGRDVWAVPGSIFSRYSEGTQILINEGAQLVRCAEDVLGIAPVVGKKPRRKPAWQAFVGLKMEICKELALGAVPIDVLAEKLGLQSTALSTELVELELLGLIEQFGNQWRLVVAQ
ncbi:MAG TPA: DNA-processing protein DprA [Patescibacteria group bacterium]|jgi:DNA processing protein